MVNRSYHKSILVTGAHRSGTTWVGKMLALSPVTYYIGEIFNPNLSLLDRKLLSHWFIYITKENEKNLINPIERILAFDFHWPRRKSFRRWITSRLIILKYTRRWFGLPQPIIKDPIAVMSSEWLTDTFHMNVICLIRHPAAFVNSLSRANWHFDFDNFLNSPNLIEEHLYQYRDQLESPPSDFLEEGALLWLCLYTVLTTYLQNHPDWALWRIEDISASPQSAFQQIFKTLNIPFNTRIANKIQGYSNPKNPVRSTKDEPHQIKRNSTSAHNYWKIDLSDQEISRIRNIVEPVSQEYYSDDEW